MGPCTNVPLDPMKIGEEQIQYPRFAVVEGCAMLGLLIGLGSVVLIDKCSHNLFVGALGNGCADLSDDWMRKLDGHGGARMFGQT